MTRSGIRARWVLGSLLALSACRIPMDDEARPLDVEVVEFDLLETTTSITTPEIVVLPRFVLRLYWHTASDNRLVIAEKGRETAPSAQEALTELAIGPLEADLQLNPDLQTLLDATMEPLLSGPDDNGIHRIQINRPATEALGTAQVAELVCTVTQFASIEQVEVVDPGGELFSLSGAGAVAITGPARASDFGDCEEELLPTEDTLPEDQDS